MRRRVVYLASGCRSHALGMLASNTVKQWRCRSLRSIHSILLLQLKVVKRRFERRADELHALNRPRQERCVGAANRRAAHGDNPSHFR